MKLFNGSYIRKHTRSRGIFNSLCTLFVIFCILSRRNILNTPLLWQRSPSSHGPWSSNCGSHHTVVIHRRLAKLSVNSSDSSSSNNLAIYDPTTCAGLFDHKGYESSCGFLKAHPKCSTGGFFNYLHFLYCDCNESSFAYITLIVWLAVLFYQLGNTATDFFYCSLEMLSCLLKLSPTVAGVTLLPLGNGAPDMFSTVAAFVGTDTGEIGFNSVLGGALFITCVVVGIVSLCVGDEQCEIDKKCFIRDIICFIIALVSFLLIFIVGKVSVGMAVAFVSIYVIYAFVVAINEILRKHARIFKLDVVSPLLPVRASIFSSRSQDQDSFYRSLLEIDPTNDGTHSHCSLPPWIWASNVSIFSNQVLRIPDSSFYGTTEAVEIETTSSWFRSKLCLVLKLPLSLPRWLTIPLVNEETWSKAYAVTSALLAPILVAFLWNNRGCVGPQSRESTYIVGSSVGFMLSFFAYQYTTTDHPPRKLLLPWVLGSFFMSIIWFYMLANDLVALLLRLGAVLKVKPSILGLTLLAWGNSMGDLVSNLSLAKNGRDGLQIAWSGCYAGPMFNTLVGLGISMLLRAWSDRSGSYIFPHDTSLFYTMGFLMLGLIWALIVLPENNMRPNRILGAGLVTIYFIFLSLRVGSAIGIISLDGL